MDYLMEMEDFLNKSVLLEFTRISPITAFLGMIIFACIVYCYCYVHLEELMPQDDQQNGGKNIHNNAFILLLINTHF